MCFYHSKNIGKNKRSEKRLLMSSATECCLHKTIGPQKAPFATIFSAVENHLTLGFPGGAVVKNPLANAGDMGSSPGQGRSYMLRSN